MIHRGYIIAIIYPELARALNLPNHKSAREWMLAKSLGILESPFHAVEGEPARFYCRAHPGTMIPRCAIQTVVEVDAPHGEILPGAMVTYLRRRGIVVPCREVGVAA